MDLAVTVAALGSFFALIVAWVSLPHGSQMTAAAPTELQPAARAA